MITADRKNKTWLIIKKRFKTLFRGLYKPDECDCQMLKQPHRMSKKIPFGSTKPKHQQYKYGKSKSEINEEINEIVENDN